MDALAEFLAPGLTGGMVYGFYFQGLGVTASGMFGALYLVVLMAWLALGCSIAIQSRSSARSTRLTRAGAQLPETAAAGAKSPNARIVNNKEFCGHHVGTSRTSNPTSDAIAAVRPYVENPGNAWVFWW